MGNPADVNSGLMTPASRAFHVTPSDTNDLMVSPVRGVYVGVSGTLKVEMADSGDVVSFSNLAPGIIHPIRAKRIYSTGTTATGIIGVW